MKIEKINDEKIRAVFTPEEILENKIDIYRDDICEELLSDILQKAQDEFCIDFSDCDLFISLLYDKKDYSFVITVSKSDNDFCIMTKSLFEEDFMSDVYNLIESVRLSKIRKIDNQKDNKSPIIQNRKVNKIKKPYGIYFFKNSEDLFSAIKNIVNIYKGNSNIYKYKNRYYLLLTKNTLSTPSVKTIDFIITEFGIQVSKMRHNYYYGFLEEYAEKIAEFNAIEVINQYF